MEPITIHIALGVAGIAALGVGWFAIRKTEKSRKLVDLAKERAELRAVEKAAELARQREQGVYELPSTHLNVGGVDVRPILFDTGFDDLIDDTADGRGKLTEEQKQTIALISQGIAPAIKVERKRHILGMSLSRRAGIPERDSIFSEFNTVDPAFADTDPNFGRK